MSIPSRGFTLLATGALAAVFFAVASGFVNTFMLVAIKHLGGELHAFQIAFFRALFGFLALIPLVWRQGGIRLFRMRRVGLNALRGAFHTGSMLCFFWAVTVSPLATVSAIAFTAPLFTALLAILVLGEKVGVRRWAGLAIGFAGALVVLHPGAGDLDIGGIVALVSSVFTAGMMICVKRLTTTENPLVVTLWGALFMAVFSLVPALFVWQWPSVEQWLWLILIGALGSTIHTLLAKALSLADTAVILPFEFLKLVWAALFGFIFFADIPGLSTWIGGAVIFVSAAYIAYRERQANAAREAGVPTPPP